MRADESKRACHKTSTKPKIRAQDLFSGRGAITTMNDSWLQLSYIIRSHSNNKNTTNNNKPNNHHKHNTHNNDNALSCKHSTHNYNKCCERPPRRRRTARRNRVLIITAH